MPNPNGAVAGNRQNIPDAYVPRTRSTFKLHYHFFNTHRFGELIPHYVEDANKDESFPIHSAYDLRSYTLESPLMQSVKRNKDYFLVPMESILPLNWEKFFDNPVRGDDVLDDVGPGVENFWSKAYTLMSGLSSALTTFLGTASTTDAQALQATMRYLIIGEYFYSNGSLLASLGCHGAPYGRFSKNNKYYTWDYYFDDIFGQTIMANLGTGSFVLVVDGVSYTVFADPAKSFDGSAISVRHALTLMRDNPTFNIGNWNGATSLKTPLTTAVGGYSASFSNANVDCDLSRLWAYQLVCAHYMSNDHIDYIYSAELFRQLIGNYLVTISGGSLGASYFFTRNGSKYQYDYLSAHCFTSVVTYASSIASTILTSTSSAAAFSVLGYFSALFAYRRSLRYLDYFTGSRAQPLAVVTSGISTNVAVNSNQVSVIDITKSIQAQRFLNSVNRVRHNFEGYLKGIFGGKLPAPDYHNPFYLAHTDDVIFGQETENTGAAQLSNDIAITTNLRGHSSNYMFDCQTDRPCIIIGITSYDISRVYGHSIERAFFKKNRFDYFNPFMQYVGDQPIYRQELGYSGASMTNFSYTIRHMEYKQRYNQCAGGFIERLPGWLFIAPLLRGNQSNISPDFIRSNNSEFDRFYVSLTGYSNGTYFHFIVDDYNSVNASRPMAASPQILG